MSQCSVVFASKESSQCKDRALNSTVGEMQSDKSCVWTSVEIHKTYTTHGGTNLSRAQLIQQISDVFADDLLIFSSPGLANIILFRNIASKLLRLVEEEEDNKSIELVVKQIVKECKELSAIKVSTTQELIKEKLQQRWQALLLLSLLSSLSEKLQYSLPALLIANTVTANVTNHPTHLQIALGIHVREKKQN